MIDRQTASRFQGLSFAGTDSRGSMFIGSTIESVTRADFTYHSPMVISIVDTGLGKCSVAQDIEVVLRKVEYWHQGSIAKLKIMFRDGKGFWHCVRWDGKARPLFP